MADSPIFIVGCPRSGTKLIRDLLRSHPNITFPHESQFIPRFYRLYGDPTDDKDVVRLARVILGLYWIKAFGLSLSPDSFAGCRSYGEVVSRVFGEWAAKEGKPRWGDKTPQYVTDIPALVEIFPSCKIIHIYRDGRDVAMSYIKEWFGSANVYSAAAVWKRMVTKGRFDGACAGPDRYMEVRYETLLDRPRETMEEVSEFIGEPFDEAMLAPSFIDSGLNLSKPGGYGTKTVILGSNQGKWRNEMPLGDRAVFESVAGDLLAELGYETEGAGRPLGVHERFIWRAQDLYKFVNKRLRREGMIDWLPGALLFRWADLRRGLLGKRPAGNISADRKE
ncbi:MAG TPA: sulfotransferase [Thermodesulfobacteriota bacterium]|nr:sulfotransferase [Thermodesulfobacteriota bacterium]